jgi:hypothetical protein
MLISAINIASIIRGNFLYTVALFEFQSAKNASGILLCFEEEGEKNIRREEYFGYWFWRCGRFEGIQLVKRNFWFTLAKLCSTFVGFLGVLMEFARCLIEIVGFWSVLVVLRGGGKTWGIR